MSHMSWERLAEYHRKQFDPFSPKETEVNRDRFPHKCPRKGCGKPAYVGFTLIDCSNPVCK